ncbi:MAG: VWA domain-containing protein [Minicystis sp.]
MQRFTLWGLASIFASAAAAFAAQGCADGTLIGLGGGAGTGGSASGGGGSAWSFDGGSNDAADDAPACAADVNKAVPVTLDMFVMLDQSGSMSDPIPGGQTKWEAVTSAIASFLAQPSAEGIGVGIQYFGLYPGGGLCPGFCYQDADCGPTGGPCSGGRCLNSFCSADADCGAFAPCDPGQKLCNCAQSCDAADYAKADVEIAALPGVAPAIIASMAYHAPVADTPTSAAIQGAIDHAKAWAAANPTHQVVVVLATDGAPAICDTNPNHINAIAASGINSMPRVPTFVIGIGQLLDALNDIAQAGGTEQAFLIKTSQSDVSQQFVDAMNTVRAGTLSCAFAIPNPANGEPDYGLVNVQYTPGAAGSMPVIIPKVASAADCPDDGDAWYYDDELAPTRIIACKTTCDTLSHDAKGEVDVLIGCKTIPK